MHTLDVQEGTVGECDDPLWHLEGLPEGVCPSVRPPFARRFLVTVIAMTTRFTAGNFG
ncbi:hypothetical protein ACFVFI_16800 [Streptomyces sp. NPDC057705]|uniref:hypothetical protein n=1 Tax=Streptomyces sp. NPDC057705 TaxID=3346222 RepID=UPI00367677B0